MSTAILSKGKLYLLEADGAIEEIRSEFADKQVREADRRQSYSPWGRDNKEAGAFGGVDVWGGHAAANRLSPYRIGEVVRMDERTLLYTMTNGAVTGLFEYNVSDKSERRLVHRNALEFIGMDYHREQELLCVGRVSQDGSAHLEFLDLNGRAVQQLTEGDSIDCFPASSHRDPSTILFQSSGIARTEDGSFHAQGPTSVNRLNLETGELDEILADAAHDYLIPREDRNGVVYCIRRPVHSHKSVPLWKSMVDFLMAPIYFAQALYNFLKIFTQLFKNDPTIAEGPPLQPPAGQQHVQILGRSIALGKAHAGRKESEASLVPDDWHLVKIAGGGAPEIVARGVCAFDIDEAGGVTYTNGFSVCHTGTSGNQVPGDVEIVERVRCL